MRVLFTLLCVFAFSFSAFAQGTIRGTILDAETGEALIGATVMIEGTTKGTSADLDGKYTLSNVPAGTVSLIFSSVGYSNKTLTGVEVKDGEVTIQDVSLGEDAQVTEAVVIEAKADKGAENAMLAVQRKAGVVQDGLSASQMSRAGDSNIAGAIKRVTGVTVEGGKYVYVRGLGDRYSKTTLNGAEIPGLDPNRNTVQMDLFPSNLISNLTIVKTFSPDLPASFTGGYVDIATKDFPDRFTFQFNTSLGFNDQASFNPDFISYEGGGLDWLGLDDGTRALPNEIADGVPAPFENNAELYDDSRAFNKVLDTKSQASFMNHSHSISLGNQIDLGGMPFGYIASVSYSRNYSYYDNLENGIYNLTGQVGTVNSLNPSYQLGGGDQYRGENGQMDVLLGALVNLSLKVSDNSKVSLNLMHNQSGTKSALFLEGQFDEAGPISPNNIFQTRTLDFQERGLSTAQLKGEHAFGAGKRLDWLTSVALSTQNQPDLRYFANDYTVNGEDTTYRVTSAAYSDPSRFYRDMSEFNWDNKVNFTVPFMLRGNESKFKTGVAMVYKNRDFNESRYDYVPGSDTYAIFDGTPAGYISEDRLGPVGSDLRIYLRNNTQPSNSYTGLQTVLGAYAMGDLKFSEKFRAIIGARYERTDIETKSDDSRKKVGTITENDILPAINLTYSVTEKMNVRASYTRTLARPTFREMAPFPSFDFTGGYILVGNADLQRTLIDNLDLRWELFPKPGEIVTVSVFYKNFTDPIERVFNPLANGEINFRNVDNGYLYGAEFEVRKNLGFISTSLEPLSLGGNIAIMHSQVDIAEDEYARIIAEDPDREPTRQMFGQSPFTANAYISYNNFNNGITSNLSFNIFGERIALVSQGGLPNVMEQPRPTLDFSVGKEFSDRLKVTVRARNLLNPEYRMVHQFKGEEYVFRNYTIGRTFSVSVKYLID